MVIGKRINKIYMDNTPCKKHTVFPLFFHCERVLKTREGKGSVLCILLLVFAGVWLSFPDKAFPDQVKTIDGKVIGGEVVHVDDEYLSIRQGNDSISFIQWRIVTLITKDREIIVVNHGENQKRFSILTTTTDSLSAKDISLMATDKITDVYPETMSANRAFFTGEARPSAPAGEKGSVLPSKTDVNDVSQKNAAKQAKPWKGNVDAGLTVKKGNTEAFTTNIKTGFSREKQRDNLYLNSLFLFETKDGSKNADEQRGTFKYERKHTKKVYSFYQESLEHDEIEKLNLRSISSLGMGYRLIETDIFKYKSEIGPSYTYERFRNDITQTGVGVRVGSYVDWQILPSTKYYFKLDYLPNLEDYTGWRIESDMGLRYSINKSLSLNVNWINDYDNKPSAGDIGKNDATILSTLGYNF